ncbi:MAG: YceI family protein [Streptosporangiales bacterium]
MTGRASPPAGSGPARRPRKRHWLRWALAGTAVLVVVVLGAVAAFIKLQPAPAPLALPAAARAPSGPLTGRWDTAPGSVAGFRVPDTALGLGNEVVGRAQAVRGSLVISGDRLVSGTIRVDLRAITVNGKRQAQFAASLGTREYPAATFTLGRPVPLGPAFAAGRSVTADITGRLTMHGVSRLVAVTLSARRSGSVIQAAGRVPVVFAAWRIKAPAGFGFLGSLADHGVAEFLLVLHRAI